MVISIFKFMREYYGVTLNAASDLTHTIIKKNFKFLRRCSYRYALKNPNLVGDGKIIYVSDIHGIIFPYICPEKVRCTAEECTYEKEEKAESITDDKSILEELSDMPTYMVHELLSKYKDIPSFYRVIRSELVYRGEYGKKKYKLRREIVEIELEEGEYNDKYQRRREIKCKKS